MSRTQSDNFEMQIDLYGISRTRSSKCHELYQTISRCQQICMVNKYVTRTQSSRGHELNQTICRFVYPKRALCQNKLHIWIDTERALFVQKALLWASFHVFWSLFSYMWVSFDIHKLLFIHVGSYIRIET